MSPLPDLLDRYTALWTELGCPRASLLRPGLPAERVRQALAAEGLSAHQEIVDWYGWHDGTELAGGASTVTLPPPRLWVFNLAEAVAERRALVEFAAQMSADIRHDDPDAGPEYPLILADYWWRPTWLPIARGGGSDRLAIDLSVDDAPGLRYWAADSPDLAQELAAPSLTALVAHWIAALESGACEWDTGGEHHHWRVDRDRLPPLPPGISPLVAW